MRKTHRTLVTTLVVLFLLLPGLLFPAGAEELCTPEVRL